MQRPAATPGRPWEVIELAVRVPVVDGIATLRDASTARVHMPLLTSIEAPPGSALVCDGMRMDAAGFVTHRTPSALHAPGCSDVVRGFLETLSPSQVEAMPAFLDWMHYDEVAVQLPENCGEEAVVVRGLNQLNMTVPRYADESAYYKYESAYYKYS
jgi:hypothetical protein